MREQRGIFKIPDMNFLILVITMMSQILKSRTVFGSFSAADFIQRLDLYTYFIDAIPSRSISDLQSISACGSHCASQYCFMFSYNKENQTCDVFEGTIENPIQINGNFSTIVYFRRKVCPPGMYHTGNDCVSCNKGTYQDQEGRTSCITCPHTYYQDQFGQESCMPCVNTTDWRYATNIEQSKCQRCWGGFNTYTDGDMSNIIRTVSASKSSTCGHECDSEPSCKMFTWRSSEGKCYLHSTDNWKWGYVYQSVIYFKKC